MNVAPVLELGASNRESTILYAYAPGEECCNHAVFLLASSNVPFI